MKHSEMWAKFDGMGVTHGVRLLGQRGTRDMGEPGNDLGLYDDTLSIITENSQMDFRASLDPGQKYIENPINVEGCAMLCPGLHWFVRGKHHGVNPCLVQDGRLPVFRLTKTGVIHSVQVGEYAIQIHSGGDQEDVGAFSAGCQVIHCPEGAWGLTWQHFFETVDMLMIENHQGNIPYLLL